MGYLISIITSQLFIVAIFIPRTTKQAYDITLTSFLQFSDHVKVFKFSFFMKGQ
jgi:hypothetical protein